MQKRILEKRIARTVENRVEAQDSNVAYEVIVDNIKPLSQKEERQD